MGESFNSVFLTSFLDQKRTLRELLSESRERADFYVFLALATFISTLGLLINSLEAIIGGMLIAPILFPMLSLSMGIVTASPLALKRSLRILSRSIVVVLLVSTIIAICVGEGELVETIIDKTQPNIFLFLIALMSGFAVSYSWVKQGLSSALPGIAQAVSLVPPLATVGIGIAFWNFEVIAGALMLFLVNCLATIIGSLTIFSLFGFSRLQREEEEKIVEEVLENKIHAKAVAEANLELEQHNKN
ncbi:MAG TPA: DUF389 domain-containing protein [Candidatus Paceibacterota bacterium]